MKKNKGYITKSDILAIEKELETKNSSSRIESIVQLYNAGLLTNREVIQFLNDETMLYTPEELVSLTHKDLYRLTNE